MTSRDERLPIDILIPVYNEGRNILNVLEALSSNVKTPYRVLICHDHDEDDTLAVIRESGRAYPNIRFIKNEGKGVFDAIQTGFKKSNAPAVIVMPADDTFNAGIIDSLVLHWRSGSEIVAPSRFMKGGCMKGCPWLKAALVRSAAFVLYHVAQLPTHDPTNGFRLFSRSFLGRVKIESQKGFAFSLELLVKCHRLGGKITEVPAVWIERADKRTRFKLFKWLPIYLRWFFFAFQTPFVGRNQGRRT